MVNSDSRVKHPALFIDFGPRPFKFLTYVGCLGVLLLTVGNVASWADSCSEEVIARNRTATVFIRAKKTLKNTGGIEYRTGTGFIVSPSGYILTNRHVIETDETVDQIEITGSIASREAVPSRLTVIARNEHDVALLKFADTSKAYVTVILGRPGEVKVGRELCSVSFPKDQESYFASGAMSSTSGDRGFWVTQMPSNPGDSGAPVFLASGEVVAIKVGGYEDLQNVNLLIPMNLAQDLVNSVPDLPTVGVQAREPKSRLEESRAIAVIPIQLQEIQRISELFDGKSEVTLREEYGFDEMFKQNVDWLFARYRHTAFHETFNATSVLAKGTIFKVMIGGGGTVDQDTGNFTPERSGRIVKLLILPDKFNRTSDLLKKFGDSAFLTASTRKLIREYISVADDNTTILGDVLEDAARELSRRYPNPSDQQTDVWIRNRWVKRFKDLSPKAQEIQANLRQYVGSDNAPAD